MKSNTRLYALFFIILSFISIDVDAKQLADTIYLGGPILTMNDKAPRAQAVAIADGVILAVGDRDGVMAYQGDKSLDSHQLQRPFCLCALLP